MSIPVFPETKVALKGKEGTDCRHRQRSVDRMGMRQGVFGHWAAELAVTYLNDRAEKKFVEAARAGRLRRRSSCRSM